MEQKLPFAGEKHSHRKSPIVIGKSIYKYDFRVPCSIGDFSQEGM